MKIILDAMGGDQAPAEPVAGAVQAAREFELEVVLVGRPEALRAELAKHNTTGLRLPIVEAPDVIPMDEHHPSDVWRRMKNSSLVVALNQLRDGGGDALVSAGNTGAVVASALFILKRVEGIERPCLATIFPTRSGKPMLIADAGATPDAKPQYLVQWARMGSIYMHNVFGLDRPAVGLLSNGEEEVKGNSLVQEVFPLLQSATDLRFIGNVEGKDIPAGTADVVITDGFTGNVVVKLAEGLGSMINGVLREEITRTLVSRVLAAGLLLAFRRLRARLDYAEYGGAALFGVRGLVIKAHGRSNARAIRSAIRVAQQAAAQGTLAAFEQIGSASPATAGPPSG